MRISPTIVVGLLLVTGSSLYALPTLQVYIDGADWMEYDQTGEKR